MHKYYFSFHSIICMMQGGWLMGLLDHQRYNIPERTGLLLLTGTRIKTQEWVHGVDQQVDNDNIHLTMYNVIDLNKELTMVSLLDLPNELLCSMFDYTDIPYDYHQLCMIHPSLYHIGRSFNTRYSFLSRALVDDDDWNSSNSNISTMDESESLRHKQQLYRSTLCQFLASSPIPLSSVFAIVLLELVPTSHFCYFVDYPNSTIKKMILQAFSGKRSSYHHYHQHQHPPQQRHHHRTITANNNTGNNTVSGKLTIPTLVNKTLMASAMTCNRHRVVNGAPRRVYYHVTLQNTTATTKPVDHSNDFNSSNDDKKEAFSSTLTTNGTPSPPPSPTPSAFPPPIPSAGDTLFALIHDTNSVTGFDQQLNCHYGTLWYEDEGIISDSSWAELLEVGHTSIRPDYRELQPSSPLGYYDYYRTYYHRGWRPCLLQTLYQCRLKRNVRKGGLKKGDVFDCVFVYEHREDDTICLEFCQRDDVRQRWVAQGFLLFAEHHIAWSS
ncbi:hypothetical protein BCR42DRAFT_485517 [Absidia repens]|uniref:F-box domain-containing protein n=1 Tax=Absidia repens TaxID=90262 RepID=A0A1X2J0J0_9FUNG|nr:hypothetical protein BCR42DRAFT_485517 [Absidia repens]